MCSLQIGAVKIISDRVTGKQKVGPLARGIWEVSGADWQDFAYVDYDKEDDMKEALANHRSVSQLQRFDLTAGDSRYDYPGPAVPAAVQVPALR